MARSRGPSATIVLVWNSAVHVRALFFTNCRCASPCGCVRSCTYAPSTHLKTRRTIQMWGSDVGLVRRLGALLRRMQPSRQLTSRSGVCAAAVVPLMRRCGERRKGSPLAAASAGRQARKSGVTCAHPWSWGRKTFMAQQSQAVEGAGGAGWRAWVDGEKRGAHARLQARSIVLSLPGLAGCQVCKHIWLNCGGWKGRSAIRHEYEQTDASCTPQTCQLCPRPHLCLAVSVWTGPVPLRLTAPSFLPAAWRLGREVSRCRGQPGQGRRCSRAQTGVAAVRRWSARSALHATTLQ